MDQFGTILRRERKERKMTLSDLAKKLGLSVPYLSQIETGSKPAQESITEKIIREFGLIGNDANSLRRAAAQAVSMYNIRLGKNADHEDRVLAASLASGFARLPAEKKEQLRRIMEDVNRG
ncbi:helix-turn-helix transcriptional regulator [Novosphingobium sp. ST904]|uniref:helix-turn-helix domain-containing protein n=1 Tax=Novosphingobium sp. ST904 TaxID=1684385 RepID=UPI0006C8A962|nr:helix-turn-helix transcriptional regulator [Novosphingobium sp. ST904]